MSVFTLIKYIFIYCDTCKCPLTFSDRYDNSLYIHPCEVCNTPAEDEAHERNRLKGGLRQTVSYAHPLNAPNEALEMCPEGAWVYGWNNCKDAIDEAHEREAGNE